MRMTRFTKAYAAEGGERHFKFSANHFPAASDLGADTLSVRREWIDLVFQATC